MLPTPETITKAIFEYNNRSADQFYKKHSTGRRPRGHYIRINGQLFPLKALWAAAHRPAIHTRDFQTGNAAAGFKALGYNDVIYKHPLSSLPEGEDESEEENSIEIEIAKRRARLATAARLPDQITREITDFVRNPDVVAEALHMAKGHCGECGSSAPFLRSKDGAPYLEVHHKVFLSQGGEDTVENAIALCPNCHRRAHFG